MPESKPRRFQFSLKWIFVPIILACFFSSIWAHYHPPLRLTETGRYSLIVDYSRSIEDGIAVGKYDGKNSDITSTNFPLETGKSGKVNLEAIIFEPDKWATTEEILKAMSREGCRPGTIQELLALGETYPNLQRHDLIIALGSRWQFGRDWFVPYLFVWLVDRNLYLHGWLGGWDRSYRFLAFRK